MYAPDSRLVMIHNWGRPNIAAGLRQSTNVFQAQFTEGEGRSYYEGVVSLASAYFIIGVILFFVFVGINIAAVCCRFRTKRIKRTCCARLSACLFAPSYWYLGALALMGILTAVAISQSVQFRTTVSTPRLLPLLPPPSPPRRLAAVRAVVGARELSWLLCSMRPSLPPPSTIRRADF